MLYFSKLRIISVIIFSVLLSYFAISNFIKIDDNFFSKNINLGLDLQGGSYLLLEIDNKPVVTQKLQSKILEFKRFFKEKNLILKNFSINNDSIIFESNNEDKDKVKKILDDDNSEINPYYPRFKSHQFDLIDLGNSFELSFSKRYFISLTISLE